MKKRKSKPKAEPAKEDNSYPTQNVLFDKSD